jgi:hypothetical protein
MMLAYLLVVLEARDGVEKKCGISATGVAIVCFGLGLCGNGQEQLLETLWVM